MLGKSKPFQMMGMIGRITDKVMGAPSEQT